MLNDLKSENIVALCDVDEPKAAGAFNAFPQGARFKDCRIMLERQRTLTHS